MKILQVQKVKGLSGSENILADLCRELVRRGNDVSFLVFTEPGFSAVPFTEKLASAGVRTACICMRSHVSPRAFSTAYRLIRKERYDIVHTHLVHADTHVLPAAALASVPVVLSTKHNDDPFRANPVFCTAEQVLTRLCFRIIAVSEHVRTFLCKTGIPAQRISVIRNGIPRGPHVNRDRDTVRADLGIAPRTVLFFIAARLTRQKGHSTLIRAFEKVFRTDRNTALAVAGTGELEDGLKNLALERGVPVRFLGYRSDIDDLLNAADVFVHPSRWEGFGIAVLEAMRSGLPVIASRAGALPELVDHGVSGLLAEPEDVGTLAGCMLSLAADADLRAAMGSEGKSRFENFTLERMTDAHEQLYTCALKEVRT
jgi:glycosyltransferase involved in cell wall biosynthesis